MSDERRSARHLLPQQRAASVRDAVAGRLRVYRQRIACATADMHRLAGRIYPYIAAELFLRWREEEVPAVVDAVLAGLAQHGLLEADRRWQGWRPPPPTSAQAVQLSLLAQATIQTIERYYLAMALLLQAGSGADHPVRARGALSAHGTAHDDALRHQLARVLRPQHVRELHRPVARARRHPQRRGRQARASIDVLLRVAEDAQLVLQEQIRHSILQIAHCLRPTRAYHS